MVSPTTASSPTIPSGVVVSGLRSSPMFAMAVAALSAHRPTGSGCACGVQDCRTGANAAKVIAAAGVDPDLLDPSPGPCALSSKVPAVGIVSRSSS